MPASAIIEILGHLHLFANINPSGSGHQMHNNFMAVPARTSMRMLSLRLRCLQPSCLPAACLNSSRSRQASRYSKPNKRITTDAGTRGYTPAFATPVSNDPNTVSSIDDPLLLYDPVGANAKKQAHHIRRVRYATVGLVASAIGMVLTIKYYDRDSKKSSGLSLEASNDSNASFQGKDVHVIGLGEGKRIVAEDATGTIDLVETGTSSVPHFPKLIYLPTATKSDAADPNAIAIPNSEANPGNVANLEEYTLIGLGIRTISFLRIQVYVMGLYVRTTDLTSLQAKLIHNVNPSASTLIPSEKEDLQARLLNAQTSMEIWNSLLQIPGIKTAWRIAPTRGTDFTHLRDGWINGINKRTTEAKKKSGNVPSEYDREDFGDSIRAFMSIFKGGKAPKGSVMILSRSASGGLDVFFAAKPGTGGQEQETQLLGSVGDERISKLIWLNYLAGDKVSSEGARKGVAEGCVALAGRPVGSAETMVA